MTADLNELLETADASVRSELTNNPAVIDKGHELDVDKLPIEKREWHKVTEAYAVVVDLASSTQMGVNKHAASTAAIYEAATGNAVRILADFDPDFLAIQGDGAFALFWGEKRFERAITAGITVKTFSERHLVPRLERKWKDDADFPETGFKVGVAASPLLTKRVGQSRKLEHQEPIWAGKAVNYASKAAQQANRHEMIVTGGVWDKVEDNEFLAATCPCKGGPSTDLWSLTEIDRLPDTDPDRPGMMLTSCWCVEHGAEYCAAVLDGQRHRPEVSEMVKSRNVMLMGNALVKLGKQSRKRSRDDLKNASERSLGGLKYPSGRV